VRLEAAAAVLGLTQTQIVADAVIAYIEAQPSAKRRVIDDVQALRQKS
jgi:hypothetical protein